MIRLKFLSQVLKSINFNAQRELPRPCILVSVDTRPRFCSKEVLTLHKESEIPPAEATQNEDLANRDSPVLPEPDLGAYVDESPVLQKFVKMGVNIYEIHKRYGVPKFFLTLDFQKSVVPYLKFLSNNGVPPTEFGQIITNNPFIFEADLDDLEVRINYLEAKKFDKNMIKNIIIKNPKWLTTPVKQIDERLGFLQHTFKLKGHQVRIIINEVPLLGTLSKDKLMNNIFSLKEEMGLDVHPLKHLILKMPDLLRINPNNLMKNYDYLFGEMNIPQDLILKQPVVLKCARYILEERHKFLQALGRAQYNPLLPGYISLKDLVETTDEEFCNRLARTSVRMFDEFVKTL